MDRAKAVMTRLGGATFQLRTGARNPQPIPGGLALDLPPARTKKGADRARITHADDGTYSLEIIKRNGRAFRWVDIADGIRADELVERFGSLTGLTI